MGGQAIREWTELIGPPRSKIRRRILPKEEQIPCTFCSQTLKVSKDDKGFGWCSTCKSWIYFEFNRYIKKKYTIQRELEYTPVATSVLRSKMDNWVKCFQDRTKKTIKIYSKEEFDQKFLMSLVPKKE